MQCFLLLGGKPKYSFTSQLVNNIKNKEKSTYLAKLLDIKHFTTQLYLI